VKALKWLDENTEKVLLFVISTVMVTVTFLQVVFRLTGNSFTWSEELARYCFIWLVYIGISYGVKMEKHIAIDILFLMTKGRVKLFFQFFANFIFLIFSLLVVFYGVEITMLLLNFGQESAALHIPMGLVYLATPVGFGLTSIRLIQVMVKEIKMIINFKEDEDKDDTKTVSV